MAHNIHFNETSRAHSFFSVKEKAWHGLGKLVNDYPTSAEAIQFAGLDYTVEKRRLYALGGRGQQADSNVSDAIPDIKVPGHFATIRTDTNGVLGVVGQDYEVVQNKDAFSFFDAIVEGEGIQYETAGALGRGERIFITAKLPDYIIVGRDDLIEQYLFLTTSHDGFGSITAAFTPIRIVCNNTLNAALRNCSNAIKIRHTANAKDRLEQAHKVMGISNKLSVCLESVFNHWAKVVITDSQVKELIRLAMAHNKEVLSQISSDAGAAMSSRFENICSSVFDYAMSSASQQTETTRGTVFGAYNAVTGYFQNVRTYKDGEAKLKSVLLGGSAQIKMQKAFSLCEEFCKKGAGALGLN